MSVGLQENTNTLGDDFESIVNSNSRKNSEMTAETVRGIKTELNSQIAKKPKEIKVDLNSQMIIITINIAIMDRVMPELQGSLSALENGLNARLDLQSVGLHRSCEYILPKNYYQTAQKGW